MAPHRVVEVARAVFPRDALATADSGAHALAVTAFWDSYDPKGFLISTEGGTGTALPAAIAAKLAFPDRPVVAFMGEGGFFASLAEIGTASELAAPVVAVVFLDESFSLVRVLQERRHYAPVGVTAGPTRIENLAEDLGACGILVETEDDLRLALHDALSAPKPAIIGVRVNPHGYRKMLDVLSGTISSSKPRS